jgi:AcrR family transcriptional regulator
MPNGTAVNGHRNPLTRVLTNSIHRHMRKASVTQPNVRDKILNVAESLFRERGYAGTTIADIASACEMSPANVYRFFESKASLCEAITGVVLKRIEDMIQGIVSESRPASERLRLLVVKCHAITLSQCLHNNQLHELVLKAFKQQWTIIEAHTQRVHVLYRSLIEDGVRSGEFAADDIDTASECVFSAVWGVCHPQIVAERFAHDHGRQAAAMADFLIHALSCGLATKHTQMVDITA